MGGGFIDEGPGGTAPIAVRSGGISATVDKSPPGRGYKNKRKKKPNESTVCRGSVIHLGSTIYVQHFGMYLDRASFEKHLLSNSAQDELCEWALHWIQLDNVQLEEKTLSC